MYVCLCVCSVVVMDYDDFSKDDLIGATQVDLYQVLDASPPEVCIKRLLDDRSVSDYNIP